MLTQFQPRRGLGPPSVGLSDTSRDTDRMSELDNVS
jgi:hypothetical protein